MRHLYFVNIKNFLNLIDFLWNMLYNNYSKKVINLNGKGSMLYDETGRD